METQKLLRSVTFSAKLKGTAVDTSGKIHKRIGWPVRYGFEKKQTVLQCLRHFAGPQQSQHTKIIALASPFLASQRNQAKSSDIKLAWTPEELRFESERSETDLQRPEVASHSEEGSEDAQTSQGWSPQQPLVSRRAWRKQQKRLQLLKRAAANSEQQQQAARTSPAASSVKVRLPNREETTTAAHPSAWHPQQVFLGDSDQAKKFNAILAAVPESTLFSHESNWPAEIDR